jgi:hypothetical protein
VLDEPELQRLVVGAAVSTALSEAPHTPSTLVAAAEHVDVAPPLRPVQVQLHGPVPVTVDAEPPVQRLLVGLAVAEELLAEPQAPWTI